MSTLAEIEAAAEKLPARQQQELIRFLTVRLQAADAAGPGSPARTEPDFLARAKRIWGEQPAGQPLSEIVAESRV